MEKIMFKLKFGMLPGHWGLVGKTREIAKAEYELTGYDLESRLLELSKPDYSDNDYTKRHIDMDFKHGKITKKEQLRLLVNLIEDDAQRNLATLELDFKEGNITDTQYQKQSATLKKEAWVTVLSMDFGGKQSLEGSFELDWNEYFVENLKKDGYVGPTPDSIVNQWFMEVCRNVALEEFDGTGDFTADSAANLETIKRWNSSESLDQGRKGYK
jgi:hypothetical protein